MKMRVDQPRHQHAPTEINGQGCGSAGAAVDLAYPLVFNDDVPGLGEGIPLPVKNAGVVELDDCHGRVMLPERAARVNRAPSNAAAARRLRAFAAYRQPAL